MLENMLVATIVPVSSLAMVVLIVWIAHRSRELRVREQAGLRRHLLDKFSSGQELSAFLETPQGRSFLEDLELGGRSHSPKQRILRLAQAGILLLALSVAFWALMRVDSDFVIPAVLLVALGIGLLLTAGVSYGLSKKWGVLEGGERR